MLQTNYPTRRTKEILTISQACTRTTHSLCKGPVEIVIKDTIGSFGGFPESFIAGFCQSFSSFVGVWCSSKAERPLPGDCSLELFSTAPVILLNLNTCFMGPLACPSSLLWPCGLCVTWMSSPESCTVNSRTTAGWRRHAPYTKRHRMKGDAAHQIRFKMYTGHLRYNMNFGHLATAFLSVFRRRK